MKPLKPRLSKYLGGWVVQHPSYPMGYWFANWREAAGFATGKTLPNTLSLVAPK